jgi:hypothetical protein
MDYAEREEIEGWEMTPYECLSLAYGGVQREKLVEAGTSLCAAYMHDAKYAIRIEHCMFA